MDYRGQTVNERIYTSGNQKRYDKAFKNKDFKILREIFQEIQLEDYNIESLYRSSNDLINTEKNSLIQKVKIFLKRIM